MKIFVILAMIAGYSSQASATGFECLDSGQNGRILATTGNTPDTLTVEFNGQVVYSAVPVVLDQSSDRNIFRSPSFTNKNGAHASLFLQVYQLNGKIYGEFSETSFLPVIPNMGGECRQM